MLFLFFATVLRAQYIPCTFADGFQPPAPKDCETIFVPTDCWGPSISEENICLWDAADGLCSEQSHEDMEATCAMFMEPSSCTGRIYCDWNASDLKCQSHELTVEKEYPDLHYVDCASQSKEHCNDYGGCGTECNWNDLKQACVRGYAGSFEFYCNAFSPAQCGEVGACIGDATNGCGARKTHVTPFQAQGSTLQKPHGSRATSSNKKFIDYRFPAYVLSGLFVGILIGSGSVYVCTKKSDQVSPVPLITPGREV